MQDESLRFEKCQAVLWAFLPDGIVLHNSRNHQYLELRRHAADVWAYMDGVHTLRDICAVLSKSANGNSDESEMGSIVFSTFEQLLEGGFLVEAAP